MADRPPTIQQIDIAAQDKRLECLTEQEISRLLDAQRNGNHKELCDCALGIVNTGADVDNTGVLREMYPDFDIAIKRLRQGVAFTLSNAPRRAFIEQQDQLVLIESIREHICAAVRDLVYQANEIGPMEGPANITAAVYRILRHAGYFDIEASMRGHEILDMDRAFMWGGHAICDGEYKYTKDVGEQMALQLFEMVTGCGPGAMRGPFSGATRANAKRRIVNAKMVGLTCPSNITSEPPNEFVNPLIIMPDIEKRLEGFVRGSIGGVIFPGGVGTAEEIQTIMSILLHDRNTNVKYPLVFTGPQSAASYFKAIDEFLVNTLGEQVRDLYTVVINDPRAVAMTMRQSASRARHMRDSMDETYHWIGPRSLYIPEEVQRPFDVTHESVAQLNLHKDQKSSELAAQMRRLFSAIVYGNVSDRGAQLIQERGPFKVHGDPAILAELDKLLRRFVSENRMKLAGEYDPCYELVM